MNPKALWLRVIGFVSSLILTLAAFVIIVRPDLLNLKVRAALIALFILAIIQFIVQFVFFLDLWREKGPRWNLFVFVTTISIILIIIAASIWIMDHLNYNMMM